MFQSLAEPNLIALNGKEASFLAGGEFPYPVPQGQFGSFTIHFKEYGVRLTFTPTVLGGDLINLKIKPEVSSLDFNNAVIIEGFRIPALTSRRAETEVELQDGQTFAIAGLLNNTALSSMRKVPGLGDIPVLGMLFKSRAYQKDQTELVVMVTPTIVRKGSTGVSAGLPSLVEPFLGPEREAARAAGAVCRFALYPREARWRRADPVPAPSPAPQRARRAAAGAPSSAGAAAARRSRRSRCRRRRSRPPRPLPVAPPTSERAEDEREGAQGARGRAEGAAEGRRPPRPREAPGRAGQGRREEGRRGPQEGREDREGARQEAGRDRPKAAEEAEKEAGDARRPKKRRKNAEDEKRDKALTDAAARLKQAQSAYQAEIAKTAREAANESPAPAPRRRIGNELRVHRHGHDGVSQRQHAGDRCRHADDRRAARRRTRPTPARWPAPRRWSSTTTTTARRRSGGDATRITAAKANDGHGRGRVGRRPTDVDVSHTIRPAQPNRVKVDVYRTAARGNPVSTLIARFFGMKTADIVATATAEASPANAMTCVKPFTIPDKWIEKQTAALGRRTTPTTRSTTRECRSRTPTSTFPRTSRATPATTRRPTAVSA